MKIYLQKPSMLVRGLRASPSAIVMECFPFHIYNFDILVILGVFDGVLLMSLRDYIGYVFSKSK